jgi:hypothetical protein
MGKIFSGLLGTVAPYASIALKIGPWIVMLGLFGVVATQHEALRADRAACTAQIQANALSLNQASAIEEADLRKRVDVASAAVAAGQQAQVAYTSLRDSLKSAVGRDTTPAPVLQSAYDGLRLQHGAAP